MEATSKLLEVLENNISNEELEYTKYLLESIDAREWELLKYKRAFEILKQIVQLNYEEDEFFCNKIYYLHSDANIQLENEEYELLEELINNESR